MTQSQTHPSQSVGLGALEPAKIYGILAVFVVNVVG